MNRSLTERLVSFALALTVTLGLAGGIHTMAASEAHAAQMAQSVGGAGTLICSRV